MTKKYKEPRTLTVGEFLDQFQYEPREMPVMFKVDGAEVDTEPTIYEDKGVLVIEL